MTSSWLSHALRTSALAVLVGSLALVGCDSAHVHSSETTADALSADARAATDVIPDQYIVVLKDEFAPGTGAANQDRAAEIARGLGLTPIHAYGTALFGFAAVVPEGRLNALANDPRVAYVEPDAIAYPTTTIQENATWGLDRIDQRALPLDEKYSYTRTGENVTAYIIDSGIRFGHSEFGGRASNGHDFVLDDDPGNTDPDQDPGEDCNGHGTHVAGTVGGITYGVAKGVGLKSVRVFGCGGGAPYSRVIAAVDWVTKNAGGKGVANMSLGGPASTALDDAVRASIASGVSYVLAAGNDSQDACRSSPARVREAMTIGSTTRTDERSSFSNVGDCVDWFAPGSGITSAWWSSDTATRTISGTSMAAPHVAGVAALYLEKTPGAAPSAVYTALYDLTTKGVVTRSRTANNHLLFSLVDGGGDGDGGGGDDGDGDSGGDDETCVPRGNGNNCK